MCPAPVVEPVVVDESVLPDACRNRAGTQRKSRHRQPSLPAEPADEAPQGTDYDDVATEERSLPLPSAIEVVVSELLGAVPEVRDHLLAAADELLDAAKAMLDAADRVVRQHREGSS